MLSTPVVSVATPSLLAPFSSMQAAYSTGEMDGSGWVGGGAGSGSLPMSVGMELHLHLLVK